VKKKKKKKKKKKMSSTVEFRLEDALAELEEQLRHGVWSKAQVRQIVAARRQHELAVQRAGATRSEYLKYIEYEINLDQLRREKIQRLGESRAEKKKKKKKNETLQHIFTIVFLFVGIKKQSYLLFGAGISRIQGLFERMLSRLGAADSALWIEFVLFCNRFRAFHKVEKVFARALRAHPAVVPLWVLAAAHEFHVNGSVDAARVLLQRAIRLNAESPKLWLELFRLELLYVDKVRARRAVLGIADDEELPDEEEEADNNVGNESDQVAATNRRLGIYDEDSEAENDDDELDSDDDKFYSRVTKAREKRLKRRREAEAANAPSARARVPSRAARFSTARSPAWCGAAPLHCFRAITRCASSLLRVATIFPFVGELDRAGRGAVRARFWHRRRRAHGTVRAAVLDRACP
jgi:hypothetical protein